MTKFNSWAMHKHKTLTAKKKEEQDLLNLAKEGNRWAIEKLRQDHDTIFRREAC